MASNRQSAGCHRELIKLTANLKLVSADFSSYEDFFYKKVQENLLYYRNLLANTFASEYLGLDQNSRNEELSTTVESSLFNAENEAKAAKLIMAG